MGKIGYTTPSKVLLGYNIGITIMNATQLFRLLQNGATVTIEKQNGVVERYSPCKDGNVAVSFHAPNTCMYCGRFAPYGCCSKCDQEIEVLSMAGAYRHINSINSQLGASIYNPDTKTVSLSEKLRSAMVVCALLIGMSFQSCSATSSVSGSLKHLSTVGDVNREADTLYFIKVGALTKEDVKAIHQVQKHFVVYTCCEVQD